MLAHYTYGTNDMYRWELFAAGARHSGVVLYHALADFNHPPSMLYFLRFLGWLVDHTSVSFPFLLRAASALADFAGLALVWKILRPEPDQTSMRWAILLLALSPGLLVISGFHGNTDSLMIFFLLLAVYFAERGRPAALSGAAFGLAVCVKLTPLIALPAIVLYVSGYRRRVAFCAAAGIVLLLGWSPFIFQDGRFILDRVFGYRSIYGHWGISYLLDRLAHGGGFAQSASASSDLFHKYGALTLLALIGAWTLRFHLARRKPPIFAQVGAILILFLAGSGGFGVHYLAWLMPWIPSFGVESALVFYTASGVFSILVYNYWCGGVPCYLADSNAIGDYQGHLDYFQIACWLCVLALLWAAWRQFHFSASTRPKEWTAICGILILLLIPAFGQFRRDQMLPSRNNATMVRAILETQLLGLSLQLYKLGSYRESIGIAQELLQRKPDSAEAYNNIGAAYAGLGLWDEAIRAETKALQIDPALELARNNLAWAQAARKR